MQTLERHVAFGERIARFLELEERANAREQEGAVDGLLQKFVRASLDRLQSFFALAVRRDDDDRHVRNRRVRANVREHVEPFEPGHHQIEQDQVERARLEQCERRASVERAHELMTHRREVAFEHGNVSRLIVDEENPLLPPLK